MESRSYDLTSRILIVDDDKSVRDFLGRFLSMKGYEHVQSAETGQEAVEIVQKGDFKLVLLDIKLPDMDGIDVLRRIKQLSNNTAVIMITGFPEEEKAKQMIKEGAYDYIIKPFDLDYLELSVLTKIILMT